MILPLHSSDIYLQVIFSLSALSFSLPSEAFPLPTPSQSLTSSQHQTQSILSSFPHSVKIPSQTNPLGGEKKSKKHKQEDQIQDPANP